ncbi:hypothetical protein HK103_003309 [Boothiomyces macroporosus]|uniref:CTLH domain-containing protein n=1 Tax=Boothiomyces macroporosus TaxID=261099 RepID=A0AAD5UIK4_9FUNG|nr:hypothetical protein HK103_003309 [Boothiomyces macroporosus]
MTSDDAMEQYEQEPQPEQKIMQKMIYDYLVHSCFSETAAAFGSACQLINNDMEVDLSSQDPTSSLEPRKIMSTMIRNGEIKEAVAFCNENFPGLLGNKTPESNEINFILTCQQFIEYARNDASKALMYAQTELGVFSSINPKYNDTLQDIIALIAYPDPASSPMSHYLSQDRRESVAISFNNYIICNHC